jgi:hypothetical protein
MAAHTIRPPKTKRPSTLKMMGMGKVITCLVARIP